MEDIRFGHWLPKYFERDFSIIKDSVDNEESSHVGKEPDTQTNAAELGIILAMASMRKLPLFIERQKNHDPKHTQEGTTTNKRIGFIGNGGICGRIKEFFSLFPKTVIFAFSKTGRFGAHTMDKFDHLLPKLDIIMAVPYSEETKHILSAERIKNMKDGALIVNLGKGELIDQEELIKHLYAGRIMAALDQTTPSQLPKDHPLWDATNTILTPHIGNNVSRL